MSNTFTCISMFRLFTADKIVKIEIYYLSVARSVEDSIFHWFNKRSSNIYHKFWSWTENFILQTDKNIATVGRGTRIMKSPSRCWQLTANHIPAWVTCWKRSTSVNCSKLLPRKSSIDERRLRLCDVTGVINPVSAALNFGRDIRSLQNC